MPRRSSSAPGRSLPVTLTTSVAPVLAALAAAGPLAAQAWNGPRALELVQRAREVRHAIRADTGLHNYRAEAQGFVYFFLDRPDSDEKTLVKTDQVALDIYWEAPNHTKQRIVGLRDRKTLPTNIKYHLDHLTVVQDDFEDHIRLGDGDEVADVTHPVAPGAEEVYDYRLSDSLTISFAGGAEDVRVYELQVRPRDMDRPGFVGTVFLDRKTAAIVRMSFTFTPASYVDPYLDYIRISLDNSLWMGRYWLPYRQEAELRRELPALDFLAGSIIRGRFEIRGYQFDQDLPDGLFRTRGVSALPEEQRRAYPFRDSLYSNLDEEGLTTPPPLEEVREQARQMVQDRYLSGLRRLRLHLPSASSAYRYDRAEGNFVGIGTTFRPGGEWALKAYGGYAFGRERPSASLQVIRDEEGDTPLRLEAYLHRLRDVGPVPAASGVVNTLGGLTDDHDWTDPWFASGIGLMVTAPPSLRVLGGVPSLELHWERQRSATNVVADRDGSGGFRPVLPVEEGNVVEIRPTVTWGGGADVTEGWGLELAGSLLDFGDRWLGRTTVAATWAREGGWRSLDLLARLNAGAVGSRSPPQLLFLLGGRETLLGHPFRGYAGDAFWLLRGEASRAVLDPWLSLRAFASAGQASMESNELPAGWTGLDPHGGVLLSVGGGVGLLWDVLRIDVGRGIDGGRWEGAFSVTRRFRGWL